MNVTVIPGRTFRKRVKQLAKKYHSIIQDLKILEEELKINPYCGVDLGKGLHKVCMSITAKGKGKSGGARVITYITIINVEESKVTLLTIYDKSEQESISDKELQQLVAEL